MIPNADGLGKHIAYCTRPNNCSVTYYATGITYNWNLQILMAPKVRVTKHIWCKTCLITYCGIMRAHILGKEKNIYSCGHRDGS